MGWTAYVFIYIDFGIILVLGAVWLAFWLVMPGIVGRLLSNRDRTGIRPD